MAADPLLLLYGTNQVVPDPLPLQAGRLSMGLRGVNLLPIVFEGYEVWHGVTFLYRDPDWGTPEPVVSVVRHTTSAQSFRIWLQGHVPVEPPIDLRIHLEGHASGRIRYDATATPRGDIQASRIGLCVMHPLSVAGRPVDVTHDDGRLSRSTFPTLIAPWPPFMLVRAIRHEYSADAWAACRFEGDVFELEDQRNNADASFKTYSRSNLMPRPYRLRGGAPIRQAVELWLEPTAGEPALKEPARKEPARVADLVPSVGVGLLVGPLPRIGVEITASDAEAADEFGPALKALSPRLLHLCLRTPAENVHWRGIAACLASAGAALRLDIGGLDLVDGPQALTALAGAISAAGIACESVAVFPGPQPMIDAARHAFPGARIGSGTPHFFTQLNRAEDFGESDFLTFTTTAVLHGADDDSAMEGLQSLPAMVSTIRARRPDAHVRIGPSGIAARSSPLGAQPASDGTRRLALARRDPRTTALFGAAWLLGYLAECFRCNLDAVTLLGLTGDAALLQAENPSIRHPAYFVLMRFRSRSGAHVHEVSVAGPRRIAALATGGYSGDGGRGELLVANLGEEPVDVAVDGWDVAEMAAVMDAQAWEAYAHGREEQPWRPNRVSGRTIRLGPFAVAAL